jgi:hypothetical protein
MTFDEVSNAVSYVRDRVYGSFRISLKVRKLSTNHQQCERHHAAADAADTTR